MWEMNCLSEGYKQAVDKIWGPMTKNGFFGRKPSFWAKKRQNCTTPPFNRNFGIFLGWHVIIWDGSQVKAFPNPDHPPLAIFLTYQAFCTGMKILHFILLRCVKLESEIFLII